MMQNIPTYIFIDDSTIVRRNMPNQIRSEMENGPVKTRPRNSTPMFSYTFQAAVNAKKLTDFRTWFKNDIKWGSSWFTMKDLLTGNLIRVRFMDTEIEWTKSGNLMRSTFTLEAYDEL